MPEAHRVVSGNESDDGYHAYLKRIQGRFDRLTIQAEPVFMTDAMALFDRYLENLPEGERQYCNCHACRTFIERFGGLVIIAPDGRTRSPIWDADDAPEMYRDAASALAHVTQRAKITGVFKSRAAVWGQPVTGQWVHFALRPPLHLVHANKVRTAGQWMAEKREEHRLVCRALGEWPVTAIDAALNLLDQNALYRSDKVAGPVRWLKNLHATLNGHHGHQRNNLIWKAVALAPAGFCHPRASMAGTLLDDITQGLDFDTVAARFAAKMHPLQYQRPQAAPTAGNIAEGEKVIAALGAERSLLRRFARLDEISLLWKPKPPAPEAAAGGGVFSHLKPKDAAPDIAIEAPPQAMTWEKFARTVLPTAETIELHVKRHDNYCALLTAVDPDAPPILAWDKPEWRNPVSHYVWHGGSPAHHWGLTEAWAPLSGITLKPSMWHGNGSDGDPHGKGVILLLRDARETIQAGNALFPETLRSELRAIRATIEAYSKTAKLEGMTEGNACGLMLNAGRDAWTCVVRVTTGSLRNSYSLDRWD